MKVILEFPGYVPNTGNSKYVPVNTVFFAESVGASNQKGCAWLRFSKGVTSLGPISETGQVAFDLEEIHNKVARGGWYAPEATITGYRRLGQIDFNF